MAMKGYSTFPKALGLEPYHQIASCHIQGGVGVLPFCRDAVGVFYYFNRLDCLDLEFLDVISILMSRLYWCDIVKHFSITFDYREFIVSVKQLFIQDFFIEI